MKTITKKEIVAKLAEQEDITLVSAAKVWDAATKLLAKELINGSAIKIKGIGTLRRVDRPAHEARKPATNEICQVPARFSFKLKAKSYNTDEYVPEEE